MEASNSSRIRTPRESLQEYGRGLAGGLLFSLPMLYTMEIWWAGFLTDSRYLFAYIGTTFLLLLGYNRYAGLREDASFVEVAIDSVEEMGMGLLTAAVVLCLLGQLTAEMSMAEILGKIVVESMTVAIGISVGTAQLGTTEEAETGMDETQTADNDFKGADTIAQLVLAFCGAILFAANVAPTEEIQVTAMEASSSKLLGLTVLSLLIGGITLLFSGFIRADLYIRRDGIFWAVFGVASSYAAALLASALILWFFQRFDGVGFYIGVAQVVVLAFPAMLGASAGRLLIQ